jgi:superfamily II DNA helicase RecQ
MNDALAVLQNIGNNSFRSLQNEVIESVLQGQDTLQ